MDNEIEEIERWSMEWVDADSGNRYFGALTGTPWQPFPNVAQRYIQTFPNKRIHKVDGGEVVKKWDTRWEDSTAFHKYWDECSTCGKKFNETGYE